MQEITIAAHNILSPLGFTTEENYGNCLLGISGIQLHTSPLPSQEPIWISSVKDELLNATFSSIASVKKYTKAEKLLILSITETLSQTSLSVQDKDLLIIISTTKGNIDLLDKTASENFDKNRIHLWSLAKIVQKYFTTSHTPILLSNACISGVNAQILAARLIREGAYKHVLVAGVDLVSKFVVSGFQSFKAIAPNPCKPFDKDREGINLGEGSASILFTSETTGIKNNIRLLGGATSNDANHISGPSRSGDGLHLAISNALKESGLSAGKIDLLNAHGTATLYNDEMESKAFALAGLQETPMNGLKGYFGHTLGAAGLIETIISMRSMQGNEVLPTLGFTNPGTPEKVRISNTLVKKDIRLLLKTASGFGGCNGALLLEKDV